MINKFPHWLVQFYSENETRETSRRSQRSSSTSTGMSRHCNYKRLTELQISHILAIQNVFLPLKWVRQHSTNHYPWPRRTMCN